MTDRLCLTTSLPCPPWCSLPRGHGFDQADGDLLTRAHTAAEVELHGPARVGVMALETAADTDGPVVSVMAPTIYIEADGDFTGPQAREIAAALLNAADAWDTARV